MKLILFSTLVGGLLGLQALGAEQPAYELSCRMKAKEVAAETYRGCVVENRKSQIDQVRADYQAKLKSLKDEYDQELKKLSGSSSANSSEVKENSSAPNMSAPSNPNTTQVNPSTQRKSIRATTARTASTRNLPKRKTLREMPAANSGSEDMTVQLRPSNGTPGFNDDSTMDIPEPVPVENVQSGDSQI